MRSYRRTLINLMAIIVLCGSGYLGLWANRSPIMAWGTAPESPQGKKQPAKIELLHSDILTYDESIAPGVQRLIGSVSFRHGNATMTCDSAYLNDTEQTFEAFGTVHMKQGDSVDIYSRYLHYDGRTKVARLRHNVRLENPPTTLYTDSLDYDRIQDIAYYFEGGSIVDDQNTLTSDYGEFHPATNDAEFRYNVRLVNDSTTMTTTHLRYNTQSRIAQFYDDTHIESQSGTIDSRRGVYDLGKNVGILLDRSVIRSDHRTLLGDSVYYDGQTRFGEAFGNMVIVDTLQKAELYGDYGYFDNQKNYAFATSRAYAIDYSQPDSLYVGADTIELVSVRIKDKARLDRYRLDTLAGAKRDSLDRYLRAFRHVRVYRVDAQAVADSMAYSSKDSLLMLVGNPISWREQRQLSGDTIKILFRDQKVDYTDVKGKAMVIEFLPDGKEYYNQIKGDSLRAYVQDSSVREINVWGEVETIYYAQQEQGKAYTGLNRMTSKGMNIKLDSGRLEKIFWTGPVAGKMYPLAQAQTAEVNRLAGFNWNDKIRPKSPADVVGKADTTGQISYTLSELKRFSGANAAIKAYQPFETPQTTTPEGEEGKSTKTSSELPPLVRRPEDTQANQPNYTKLIDGSWVYNIFSSKDDQDSSHISPSIGIPVKKN